MEPAVYFSFQQIINALYSKNFNQDRYRIISTTVSHWEVLTVLEAMRETFHIVDTVSNLYLYTCELDDIMKGRKVERLNERS